MTFDLILIAVLCAFAGFVFGFEAAALLDELRAPPDVQMTDLERRLRRR